MEKFLPNLETGDWTSTVRGSEICCEDDPEDGGVVFGLSTDFEGEAGIINLLPAEAIRLGEWLIECGKRAKEPTL